MKGIHSSSDLEELNMQYIDNSLLNSPDISNSKTLISTLKSCLCDGFGEKKVDAKSGQKLTFNSGYPTHELTYFKISDGANSVFSKVKIINVNTIEVYEDISMLSGEISISVAPCGFEYIEHTNNEVEFKNNKFSFLINEKAGTWRAVREGVSTSSVLYSVPTYKGDWRLFASDEAILVVAPSSGKWSGVLYVVNNDYLTLISKTTDAAGQVTDATSACIIKSKATTAKRFGISEFGNYVGPPSSIDSDRISFAPLYLDNIPIPYLRQTVGSMAFTGVEQKIFYIGDEIVVSQGISNKYYVNIAMGGGSDFINS